MKNIDDLEKEKAILKRKLKEVNSQLVECSDALDAEMLITNYIGKKQMTYAQVIAEIMELKRIGRTQASKFFARTMRPLLIKKSMLYSVKTEFNQDSDEGGGE